MRSKKNSYEKPKKKEKLTDTIVVITHCKKVIEHNLGRKKNQKLEFVHTSIAEF